jgi:hypothetical protein
MAEMAHETLPWMQLVLFACKSSGLIGPWAIKDETQRQLVSDNY